MVPLIKNSFSESSVVQDLTLSWKKYTRIITNVLGEVLGKRETEKIVHHLINNKFFILIDKSTTITNDKLLCILVKYFSVQNKKVVTQLLELIHLNATDCSAEKLYSAFEHCLKVNRFQFQISLEWLVITPQL